MSGERARAYRRGGASTTPFHLSSARRRGTLTGGRTRSRTDGRGSEKHSGLLPIVNGLEKRATDMYINRRGTETMRLRQ